MSADDSVWKWRIPEWFQDLDDNTLHKLKTFHSDLIEFNGRMNLISPRTEREADKVHFADGIMGSRIIKGLTESNLIFDLGSGNGVPGLVMAALFPSVEVVPVEADARKVEFIKYCVGRMALSNVRVIHARVEDLKPGAISCAVTRAMAPISKALLFSRKAVSSGAELFHFKGSSWAREVAQIPSQVMAHWDVKHISDYSLPESTLQLTIILTKKK